MMEVLSSLERKKTRPPIYTYRCCIYVYILSKQIALIFFTLDGRGGKREMGDKEDEK